MQPVEEHHAGRIQTPQPETSVTANLRDVPLSARPGIRRQALSGLFAQVTQGAAAVGIVLVVRRHTGSLALAGAVVGALAIAAGIARPPQGRVIDRRGAAGVMAICGLVHPAALIAIVVASGAGTPGPLLVALGALAGAFLPPVSTSMRVAWGAAVGEGDRTAAYSFVYLTQQLAILTGPLILAAVTAASSASAALIAVALVAAAGTLMFAYSVRGPTEPAHGGAPHGSVLRVRAIRIVLAVAVLLGAIVGAIDVAVPTSAIAHEAPAAGGVLIAVLSVGGIAGAVGYGRREWRAGPERRLPALLASATVAAALMVAATGLVALGALLLVAGLSVNPTLTTLSLLADRHARGGAAAEAFGWLSTGIAGGTGAGSALAGVLAQHGAGSRPAFVVAALAGVAATALAAGANSALRAG